jgi:hypothetical protein
MPKIAIKVSNITSGGYEAILGRSIFEETLPQRIFARDLTQKYVVKLVESIYGH